MSGRYVQNRSTNVSLRVPGYVKNEMPLVHNTSGIPQMVIVVIVTVFLSILFELLEYSLQARIVYCLNHSER